MSLGAINNDGFLYVVFYVVVNAAAAAKNTGHFTRSRAVPTEAQRGTASAVALGLQEEGSPLLAGRLHS